MLNSLNYRPLEPTSLLSTVKMSAAVNEEAVNEKKSAGKIGPTSVGANLKLFTVDSFSSQNCK